MTVPTECPNSITYSEIIDMNESWVEATYPDQRYKCFAVIPTTKTTPRITLKDLHGKTIHMCFEIGGQVLFEDGNIMWYNEIHRIQCPE